MVALRDLQSESKNEIEITRIPNNIHIVFLTFILNIYKYILYLIDLNVTL